MKKISIPEPCHENWADFTPTQKGAFCGSCKIDVVDFSDKSSDEVKEILQQNAGKHMCGRFKKTQLTELNNDFFAWQNQSSRSFQSKFLYACLIVFGMTLFTGCSSLETVPVIGSLFEFQNEKSTSQLNVSELLTPSDTTKKVTQNTHKLGKIKYTPELLEEAAECATPPDSLDEKQTFTKGNVAIIEEDFIKGDIDVSAIPSPPDSLNTTNEVDTLSLIDPYPIDFIMGDIIAEPHISIDDTLEVPTIDDTLKKNLHQDSLSNLERPVPLFTDEMVDGGLMIDPEFFNYIEDTIEVPPPETVNEEVTPNPELIPIQEFNPLFAAKLFPNPTKDKARVEIEVLEKNEFKIYLYAIDGKKIRAIYDGLLERGVTSFSVDLTTYQTGSYLIVIKSANQKESLRLEKVE
jgi:hypothetical protein